MVLDSKEVSILLKSMMRYTELAVVFVNFIQALMDSSLERWRTLQLEFGASVTSMTGLIQTLEEPQELII